MSSNTSSSQRPSKIIITLTPSLVLNHPFTVIGHKIAVLRFQRSLCDVYSTSNGFLRGLNVNSVGPLPVGYGFSFLKDFTLSIYKSEGFLGFFRCLPEFIAYHLIKDVLRYLVPNLMLPRFSSLTEKVSNKLELYNILDSNYKARFRSRVFSKHTTDSWLDRFVGFYRNRFESERNRILTSLIIEVLTYPALTIISRLIIYDGYGPVSFYSLLKHTLEVDGFFSLYRGFFFHTLSNCLKYVLKNFNKFVQDSMISDYYMSSMFEQSFPVVLSISDTVINQFSLIRRCGSNIDGFCINESSVNIFRQIPWTNIFLQMFISIGLIHLKDRLLAKHLDDLNSKMY